MSYLPPPDPQQQQQPPQAPGYPPPFSLGQALPQPTPVKRSKLPWIIAGAAAAFLILLGGAVGIAVVAVSYFGKADDTVATKPLSAWDKEQRDLARGGPSPEDESGITAEPAFPGPVPSAADIVLKPKITDKQCFGSAGCNVTFKVDMSYGGPALSPDETWEVTYEVKGDKNGPIIGTFEISGDEYTVNEESLSTKSNATKVTIKVTDVEKVDD